MWGEANVEGKGRGEGRAMGVEWSEDKLKILNDELRGEEEDVGKGF